MIGFFYFNEIYYFWILLSRIIGSGLFMLSIFQMEEKDFRIVLVVLAMDLLSRHPSANRPPIYELPLRRHRSMSGQQYAGGGSFPDHFRNTVM
jgi:hypothetical protein